MPHNFINRNFWIFTNLVNWHFTSFNFTFLGMKLDIFSDKGIKGPFVFLSLWTAHSRCLLIFTLGCEYLFLELYSLGRFNLLSNMTYDLSIIFHDLSFDFVSSDFYFALFCLGHNYKKTLPTAKLWEFFHFSSITFMSPLSTYQSLTPLGITGYQDITLHRYPDVPNTMFSLPPVIWDAVVFMYQMPESIWLCLGTPLSH